uniref:Uncharacterized protein n=1 Tax=Arundo donax TaxID=35708 RepID=A0A0A8ZV13_ARUDO
MESKIYCRHLSPDSLFSTPHRPASAGGLVSPRRAVRRRQGIPTERTVREITDQKRVARATTCFMWRLTRLSQGNFNSVMSPAVAPDLTSLLSPPFQSSLAQAPSPVSVQFGQPIRRPDRHHLPHFHNPEPANGLPRPATTKRKSKPVKTISSTKAWDQKRGTKTPTNFSWKLN